jgi:3-phenylpropionate/cinnamic acid dioxygenase small subunit
MAQANQITNESAADFVYREARAIDEKRFDDWYEMFTEDAIYWMPLTRNQPDGINHNSLFYDDRLLLKVRIERLKSPRSFSQAVPSYCQHVLQQPMLERRDPDTGECVLRTPMIYVETRRDEQIVLAATAWHHLVTVDGAIRMRLKKVELVNPDAGFPSIQMFP